MAVALASQSPLRLVLASRTRSKMEQVAAKIKSQHADVDVELVEMNLSSLQTVREGAKAIDNVVDKIDLLINNAAVVMQSHTFTSDDLELQFGTNHVGIFLLTNLLLPKILQAGRQSPIPGSTRIINVTSAGHVISPIRFSDYNMRKRPEDIPADERPSSNPNMSFDPPPGKTYVPFVAYGQSKTANILHSQYLSENLAKAGVRSMATHPGSIWTDLSRNLDEQYTDLISKTGGFWKNLDQGSATTLVAALDPKLGDDIHAIYLSDCQLAQPAAHASDAKAAERLWVLSEQIVGEKFDLATQAGG